MALNIRNHEARKLAAALAVLTGENKTLAVTKALRDRLERMKRQKSRLRVADRLDEIALHCASLPVLDKRGAEEMLYDQRELPT